VPFDKFGAHLVGEKGMLVIGRIVDARRQHRDRRRAVGAVGRRAGGERTPQVARIGADRLHRHRREQFGKHVQHRLAVFQHVGNARRRARIVLQHVEIVLARAHQIRADDMGVDAAGRLDADHLRQEGVIAGDQFHRDAAGAQDLLTVINVVQKGVDGGDALFDAAGQPRPFAARNDARHHVERDQPFGRVRLAIDIEGDPHAPEEGLGLGRLVLEAGGVFRLEPAPVGEIG
jgi:hypothetical protein